jgi:hypothetical protein
MKEEEEIDTEVRHITKAGTNIFSDLGFSDDEAQVYQEELQQYVAFKQGEAEEH